MTLIFKKRLFSSPAAFALTLEAHLESEDQNRHPERAVVTPSVADDSDWMDDVLGWDAEPSDDDPGSDDEREVFGRVAGLPGIFDDAGESGGSVMEAAYRRQLAEWAQRHAEPADTRVARKVATERQDLGSVNPVLAHAVEARMLGRPRLIDPLQVTPRASTSLLRAERDLRDQVRRLHDQLDASVRELHVAPANVRRVVDTALALVAAWEPGASAETAPPRKSRKSRTTRHGGASR